MGTISGLKNQLYYLLSSSLAVKRPSRSLNSLKVKRVSTWLSNTITDVIAYNTVIHDNAILAKNMNTGIVVTVAVNTVVSSFPIAKKVVNFIVDVASPTDTVVVVSDDIAAHHVSAAAGIKADVVEVASTTTDSRISIGEPVNTVVSSEHIVAFIVNITFQADTMATAENDSASHPYGSIGGIKVTASEYY